MRTNSAVWLKTPKYFDLLVWGDFVVGLALIGLAALLIIVLLIGLNSRQSIANMPPYSHLGISHGAQYPWPAGYI